MSYLDIIKRDYPHIRNNHTENHARKVWYHRDLSIINLPNAKCGQHSIKKTTEANGFELIPLRHQIYQDKPFVDINNCFVFAVIRNPFERYLSAYVKVVYDAFNAKKKIMWQDPKIHWEIFKYFTDIIASGNIFNIHFSPQWHYFRAQNRKPIPIDLYIDLDNLKEGLSEINNRFNLNLTEEIEYTCLNPTIKEYIRKRLKNNKKYTNIINKFYKKDWEMYEKHKSRP